MKAQLQEAWTILRLIHKQRPYVIFYGFSASLLKTLTAYLPLWFTSILINLFLAKTDTQSLFLSVLLFACCMLLSEGGQYVLEYRLNIAVKELELGLEKNISEKAMYLSYDKLEDKDTLDLIEKAKAGFMQNGGIQVMMAQFSALLEICCTIVISFGLLLYLLSCHGTNKEGILGFMDTFWAGLVLLMLLCGYALFGKYLSKEFSKAGMKFFDQNAKLSRENNYYSSEVALNQKMAKDVRLFQMQDTVLEEMAQRQQNSLKYFTIFNHRIAMLFSESVFLGNMMNGFFYMFVILKVYVKSIPVGDFVTYAGTITKLNDAISTFPIIYTDLMMLFHYMSYYNTFLQLADQKEDSDEISLQEDSEITFDHVTYAYPGSNQPALHDVSLTLEPHKKTAIVGLNGAGKTTLIKLLCGLYEPSEGTIRIDGKPVTAKQLSALQNKFGVVFQDFALFAGTLKENITCTPNEKDEAIRDVLNRSGFAKRLATLPDDIHTMLGVQENGIQLSGGEAQKVAIARALYADRPWIILDEPTAALDPLSEIEIYTHLNELIQNKSAIYISHRMSSCQFCDDILVFEHGNLIQRGSHAQLLQQDGLYQQLWTAQAAYFQEAS
ncbi:MAG: ABC transporter ATP-binding protein [Longicatena caecimuris]|uniref:ABC transporter ATP-binding protein n=1 Tax=Longicatena caecimuris TaxID=1796635 RepID=UPI0039966041